MKFELAGANSTLAGILPALWTYNGSEVRSVNATVVAQYPGGPAGIAKATLIVPFPDLPSPAT